jgi:hypothetical protein
MGAHRHADGANCGVRDRKRPRRPLASLGMPLRPLGVTVVLAGLDLAAWEWATGTDHPTVGLVAGLLMAPIALALAWWLFRVLLAFAQLAVRRITTDARPPARTRNGVAGAANTPFDIERDEEPIAA